MDETDGKERGIGIYIEHMHGVDIVDILYTRSGTVSFYQKPILTYVRKFISTHLVLYIQGF